MRTALISRSIVHVRWEELEPGPVGEYIAVFDVDPASACAYRPVDLDRTLGTDGLAPSTGNPMFHQQMVYAVAMLTIANFERILGRHVLWAPRVGAEGERIRIRDQFVQRLWIYPHALREQNAYYSPDKHALLFGYFNAPTDDPRDELPGGIVFTCLSHDIIAHETTHAILHGIHPRLLEASNEDMLAFHEAFSDLVAIFQHFTMPGLLLDQIQRTRGALDQGNLLSKLASQFARATGGGSALRDALDTRSADGAYVPPDPTRIHAVQGPHARGAILVAAVFSAFLRIYESRVADLRRIATNGSGILPEGEIHPDLAKRFADEAVEAAERVLSICIRAIDYLPPVDQTIGDFLRALITADADLSPDDPRRERLAFLESFRERGLYPLDVRSLAEDTLRWQTPNERAQELLQDFLPSASVLRTMTYAYDESNFDADVILDESSDFIAHLNAGRFRKAEEAFLNKMWTLDEIARDPAPPKRGWKQYQRSEHRPPPPPDDPTTPSANNREVRFVLSKVFAVFLNKWLVNKVQHTPLTDLRDVECLEGELGLSLQPDGPFLKVEVHAVRPTTRISADGSARTQLLVILMQSRKVELTDDEGERVEDSLVPEGEAMRYTFRGGCTLILDPELGRVDYAISKNIGSDRRAARQGRFLRKRLAVEGHEAVARYGLADTPAATGARELLASLHRDATEEGTY